MTQKERADKAISLKREAVDKMGVQRLRWDKYYNQYLSVCLQSLKPTWLPGYVIPVTRTAVESYISRMSADFLNAPKGIIDLLPPEPGDIESAKVTGQLLAYYQYKDRIGLKLVEWAKDALIYGTAIQKCYYKLKFGRRSFWEDIVDFFGSISRQRRRREIKTDDRPVSEVVHPYRFFVDPEAESINGEDGKVRARYCGEYYKLSRAEIEARIDMGMFSKKGASKLFEKYPDGGGMGEPVEEIQKRASDNKIESMESRELDGKYSVFELWYDIGVLDGNEDPMVMVVAEDDLECVLRDEVNPLELEDDGKPYVKTVFINRPHEFWGIGLPELIEDPQRVLDDLVQKRQANLTLLLNKTGFYNKQIVDLSNITLSPGMMIPLEDSAFQKASEAFFFVPYDDYSSSIFQDIQFLIKYANDVTGVQEIVKGASEADIASRQTATEIETKFNAALTRFSFYFKYMCEQGLVGTTKMFLSMAQQFVDKPTKVRITGNTGYQWADISPEDICKDYDLRILVDPLRANTIAKKNNFLTFLQTVGSIPQLAGMTNWEEMYRIAADIHDLPVDKLIQVPPPQPSAMPGGPQPMGQPGQPGLDQSAQGQPSPDMGMGGIPGLPPGMPPPIPPDLQSMPPGMQGIPSNMQVPMYGGGQ